MDSSILVRAIEYAGHVHRNQKRKLSDNPFIVHPLHVALVVSKYTNDINIIAAAILHDTIEDSESDERVTRDDIAQTFNEQIADIVDAVTIRGVDTMESKALSRAHILASSWESQLVKTADIISNMSSNITRLDSYSIEEIEHTLDEKLDDLILMNKEFIDAVTDTKVLNSGIIAEAQTCLEQLNQKLKEA